MDREHGVDEQKISPPVFRTIDVLVGGWIEYGIIMEPSHGQLYDAQNEEIRRGKSAKPFTFMYYVINLLCYYQCWDSSYTNNYLDYMVTSYIVTILRNIFENSHYEL